MRSTTHTLLITRNLPPELGGMQRLNLRMASQIADRYSISVIGPKGCRQFLPFAADVAEISVRPLPLFFLSAAWQGLKMAARRRPSLVIAGSGLTAPFAWLAAKVARAHFFVYVHGLDLIADSFLYRLAWLPAIRRADLCIANSANTAQLTRDIGVADSRICVIAPGIDLPSDAVDQAPRFREMFQLGDRPLLLSVGRLIARKGLLEFVEQSLPTIVKSVPDVCVVVLGDETPRLLAGDSTGLGDRIRARAAALGLEKNIRFIGPQSDEVLAAAYRECNAHVFPVTPVRNDVEGFGMVAIEAAAHGLPTVAFALGGVVDAVADGVSGYLVASGNYEAFSERIIAVLRNENISVSKQGAEGFARRFAWENFGAALRAKIESVTTSP